MYLLDDLPPDEEQMQTLHLYVYQDEPKRPLLPVSVRDSVGISCILALLLGGILAVCFLPTQPADAVRTIAIPAQLLPLAQFQGTSTIIPTGTQTYPATSAHGLLTIYNGSILTQELPAGFLVTTSGGVEIALTSSVTVPPANPPSYGTATVDAVVLTTGKAGNIPAYTLNAVYGAALYIKNEAAFRGGTDARAVRVVIPADTTKAVQAIRRQLIRQQARHPGLLRAPCQERLRQHALSLQVTWRCQFVRFTLPPGVAVLSAQLVGVQVRLVIRSTVTTRPVVFPVK